MKKIDSLAQVKKNVMRKSSGAGVNLPQFNWNRVKLNC